jgi:hypothetical protein
VTGSRRTNDVGVAALLEVRIEDRVAGRAPARLPYLGESRFSKNSSDDVLF